MVSKNVVAIYKEFRRIKDQVNYIQSMYEQDVDKTLEVRALSSEPGFVEAAYELLDDVKEFVKLIEESDPNLDPEKTKLEGVDSLFKGHFVTDHMNNVFNEVYNSQGVCPEAPCKAEDENCCKNKEERKTYRYEGYCWCGFLKKLQKEKKTIATCGISQRTLESIEMTRDPDGNCFICEARKQNKAAVDEFSKGAEVKSAILRATDPVEPFVRPNPTCKLVCTRNHCSCEDGW